MRKLSFAQALNEAFHQIMQQHEDVFLIGQGLVSPWYVGTTTVGLIDSFGEHRIIDTPVSENGITGAAIGAALAGKRPVVEHPRLDFMNLAIDQIANNAANWHFMFGGEFSVPLTIWGMINRGGEQGAQHSQATQAMYAHLPGLKIVMPCNAYDAKGLLYAAIMDNNPVLFIDDRWLYAKSCEVPENLYSIPIGQADIKRTGNDVTLISSSYMTYETLNAAEKLSSEHNVHCEVIDLRTIKPLDTDTILASVKKTGRVVIADGAWQTCGLAAEISAQISETGFKFLQAPIRRVTLPDCPAPVSSHLEEDYYPTQRDIIEEVLSITVNYE